MADYQREPRLILAQMGLLPVPSVGAARMANQGQAKWGYSSVRPPNQALEPTSNSLRSYVSAAIGRG